jgi:protein O-GlcNAc transferase
MPTPGRHWASACSDKARLARHWLPQDAQAQVNLGTVLRQLGRLAEAETHLRLAAEISPEYVDAHANLGGLLAERGRHLEAETCFRRALDYAPDNSALLHSLGCVLALQNRLGEAVDAFRRTLALEPNHIEAHANLGAALAGQNQMVEAEASLRAALALNPAYVPALSSLTIALRQQGKLLAAAACCRRALQFDPANADLHHNLGLTLEDIGDYDEALACLQRALELNPGSLLAQSNFLFTLNYHPDKSANEVFEAYREYDRRFWLQYRSAWREHSNDRNPARRLRVGYVSPDFRAHACRSFLEPLLAHHDKAQVEVFAYASLAAEDEFTARYRAYADHWVRTENMGDDALAERIRGDGIDILVDLASHTQNNQLPVFARKPAPVSLTWLGYGYTTGLTAIDYFLTDPTCAPEGSDVLFSEQPWRLATPAFVYRPSPRMGEPGPLPALQRGYVTFGTLTRAIRLNHRAVEVWAQLLKAVPDSRLVVDNANFRHPAEQEYLAARFNSHGIARERLEIGFHSPPWDVLRGVDIGLDCFPHNSGTTLFESLYMGVPVVTLAARPSVGRLGSTILQGLGRPEWIAGNEDEYVAKAAALALDIPRLAQLRQGLRGEMERSPLCDESGFARKVEAAYRQMFHRWLEKTA